MTLQQLKDDMSAGGLNNTRRWNDGNSVPRLSEGSLSRTVEAICNPNGNESHQEEVSFLPPSGSKS